MGFTLGPCKVPIVRITRSKTGTIHLCGALAPGMEKLTLILIIIGVALILTTGLSVIFG